MFFFQSNYGEIITLLLNQNRTVDEMLTIYLKTIKKPELIGHINNPRFIYNCEDIYFGDKTLILQYFKNLDFQTIKVV